MPGHLITVRPHLSLLDGPIVGLHLRKLGLRGYTFAVDPAYALHSFWRPALLLYGRIIGGHRMVALDQRNPHAMRTLLRLLQQDAGVVIFPQGAGIHNTTRPDQPGVDWLILRSECRVTDLYLSHAGRLPRVACATGTPIFLRTPADNSL